MKSFLKILIVLAVLFVVFSIFIATKPNTYDVTRTQLIKAPTALTFNTVNDYKTWQEWGPWQELDTTIVVVYDKQTSGVGAGYSWTSKHDEPGSMKTINIEENKAINQKLFFKTRGESEVYWRFKSLNEATEVTWGMKGHLGFMAKILFFFRGGQEKLFGTMLEKGLKNLEKFTQKEMDKHSFTNNGVVDYGGGYFVHLRTSCSFDEMNTQLDKMLPEVLLYCMKKQYSRAGSLFTLYHKHDKEADRVEFSSCYPVKERVETTGEFLVSFLNSGRYHKTTFKGDYKYTDEAWKKAFEFAKAEGFIVPEDGEPFEVYTKGHTKSLNPADWITEIYLPVE